MVYVIDSADTKRVKEAGEELEKLLVEKELSGVPLLIFANKQDLVQALQPDEVTYVCKIDPGKFKNGRNQEQKVDNNCMLGENSRRTRRWIDLAHLKC